MPWATETSETLKEEAIRLWPPVEFKPQDLQSEVFSCYCRSLKSEMHILPYVFSAFSCIWHQPAKLGAMEAHWHTTLPGEPAAWLNKAKPNNIRATPRRDAGGWIL
jgi:hypothetical protein